MKDIKRFFKQMFCNHIYEIIEIKPLARYSYPVLKIFSPILEEQLIMEKCVLCENIKHSTQKVEIKSGRDSVNDYRESIGLPRDF